MKIGISEWSLHQNFGRFVDNPRPMTVPQFMELSASWGAEAVQVESVPDSEAAQDKLREKAQSLGLIIEVETCGIDPDTLLKKLQAAKRMGAKVVRSTLDLDRYRKAPTLAEQFKLALERLKRIAGDAEKLGLRVGIENHQALVLDKVTWQDCSGSELAQLLDEVDSPYLGVCLDTGNPLGFCDDVIQTARLLAPRTVAVHFKDYRIKRTFRGAEFAGCPLGEGVIDLAQILRLLREFSPMKDELCLSIEAPVERIQVPFLDGDFWNGYKDSDATRLPAFLRFLASHGEPVETDLRLPAELGKDLAEVLAHEQECNRSSVATLRKMLSTVH